MKIHLYTDGACEGNQFEANLGGWGVIVVQNNQVVTQLSGSARDTTNNRMELFAVIQALKFTQRHMSESPESKTPLDVHIYSDSAYIVNCIQQQWYTKWQKNGWTTSKGEAVKNPDLWKHLLKLLSQLSYVEFHKVAAHSGHRYNELADQLAVAAIDQLRTKKNTR